MNAFGKQGEGKVVAVPKLWGNMGMNGWSWSCIAEASTDREVVVWDSLHEGASALHDWKCLDRAGCVLALVDEQ